MVFEVDSSRVVLAGSLETAAPSRALAGAHMRHSGTTVMTISGKGLGHVRGIYHILVLYAVQGLGAALAAAAGC